MKCPDCGSVALRQAHPPGKEPLTKFECGSTICGGTFVRGIGCVVRASKINKDGWIVDRQPERSGDYVVTVLMLIDCYTSSRQVRSKLWFDADARKWSLPRVLAWKPLPAPYTGERTLLDLEK